MLAEGTAAVHGFTASDETDVFWSINGGTDGDLFDIDQNTGALTFKTTGNDPNGDPYAAPSYKDPSADDYNDGDNAYEVIIRASDASTR